MKHVRCVALMFVSILIVTPISPSTVAESSIKLPFENICIKFFEATAFFMGFPWAVMRFTEPESFIATPNTIDIMFLNETEIIIGAINSSSGDYISLMDENYEPGLFISTDYEFKLEVPSYLPENAFIAHFDPQTLETWQEGELKTKLMIYSNIPKDATFPENIQLTVNVTKYVTGGNLYLPQKGNRGLLLGMLDDGNLGTPRILWFLNSLGIMFPFPFGTYYSGKRRIDYSAHVDIIVNLNRFHLADIKPISSVEMGPDQIISIPIEIQNLGSHIDCFNFKVNMSTDDELIVSPPSSITLEPNEIGYASVGVASPHVFNDPGTAHIIDLEAYSIYDSNSVFNNTITVITRGVYISEMNIFYSAIFLIVIVLFALIFSFRRRQILSRKCKKPEKPWEIAEEKKYLEELIVKDEKKYEEVLQMMEDEYQSAMLWYKGYRNVVLENIRKNDNLRMKINNFLNHVLNLIGRPEKKEKTQISDNKKEKSEEKSIWEKKSKEDKQSFLTGFLRKSAKDKKKKSKETFEKTEEMLRTKEGSDKDKSAKKEEKITEETKDIKKDKAPKIESPKKTADQRRKEKVLSKIKREQEKQKLKIRG